MDESMSEELLNIIVNQHEKWLRGEPYGQRAILENEVITNDTMMMDDRDLRYAVFRNCTMVRIEFWETQLAGARFESSDLRQARFMYADMRDIDLRDANLVDVQIDSCNLIGACIDGARLGGNRLFDIEMDPQNLMTVYRANRIVPETGEFKAWKKVDEHLVELTIPEDAERIGGLAGPKCRVSHAYVQSITEGIDYDPEDQTSGPIKSDYDPAVVYEVGHRVVPDEFDNRVDRDCTNGIHCFVEREHAINF